MKVVFLNRFFFPDTSATSQILSDLTSALQASSDVHVITSRLLHDGSGSRLPAEERIGGVTVHRIWTSGFGRDSLAGRSIDYATFYLSAVLKLFHVLRKDDVVIAMTDPPMMAVPIMVVARFRRARLINWLHDLFPEVAVQLDFKELPLAATKLLLWLRDRSLRAAETNVVLGDVMAERIRVRGVSDSQTSVIHNWASGLEVRPLDRKSNRLRVQWDLQEKFVVGYSGNIGRANEFEALLGAAERLLSRPEIAFLFIGDGPRRQLLERAVARRGLTNVTFRPHQRREVIGESLTVPDCHVVTLKPVLEGLVVPSKIYSSLATGRPMIFIGAEDGEVGRLMQQGLTFGVRVAPADSGGLAEVILRWVASPADCDRLGSNARRLFEARFERKLALEQWSDLIGQAVNGSRVTSPRPKPPFKARVAP